jgi:hypothetical protein
MKKSLPVVDLSVFLVSRPSFSIDSRRVRWQRLLTLVPDEIANLLILGLFDRTLVVLGTLLQELLLDEIDAFFLHKESVVSKPIS